MSKGFVNFKNKMGKIAVTGLLVGATTVGAHASGLEAVTTANLNMRTGEGTNYKIVQTIKKGEKVEVLDREGSWWKVKYNNKTGYSYKNYLTIVNKNKVVKNGKVSVGNSRLNVRTGAGTNYRIIGKLHTGDAVQITGTQGSWYEINYKGSQGFVSSKYVTGVTDAGNNEGSTPVNKTMKVNTKDTRLNVRNGAGTSYKVIGKLNKGSLVKVIEKTSNGWYKIEFNGGTGFVSGQYLTEVSDNPTQGEDVEVIGTAKVTTEGGRLNLRKGQGTNTSVIASLNNGLTVELVKDSKPVDGWTKVKVGNLVGYVSSQYLNKETVKPEEKPEQKPGTVMNQAPVISAKEDLVLQVGDTFDISMLEIKATDLEDKDLTSAVKVDGEVDTKTLGKYELTLTVEDSDGAETVKKVFVVVEEKKEVSKPGTVMNQAPVIESVEELTIEQDSEFSTELLKIVVTDKEDGTITEGIEIGGDEVDTSSPGEYNVTVTVTDSKGAKATKTIKVIVEVKEVAPEENTAPVIESVDSLTLTVGDTYNRDMLKIKATDKENDEVKIDVDDSKVNTKAEGHYEVVITATDAKGAKTVKKVIVTVNAKPSIPGTAINNAPTLNVNNYALDINNEFSYGLLGASATDKEGEEVTIRYSGSVNTKKVGTYTVEVTATDAKGAKTTKEVQVKVNAVKPTITANGLTITQGEDFNYSMLGASAVDCEGTPISVNFSGEVNTEQPGSYTITVSAEDKWGLTASKTVTVTVEKKAAVGITDPNDPQFQAMVANEMYALINAHRRANGVNDYVALPRLQNMAHYKSKHMADNNYFEHTYNGQFIWELNPSFGTAAGENIAINYLDEFIEDGVLDEQDAKAFASKLFNQWKASVGHNNAMLNKVFKSVGFGFYAEESPSGGYTVYATQIFEVTSTYSEQPTEELGKKDIKKEEIPVDAVEENKPVEEKPQVEIEDTKNEPTVDIE